MRASTGTATVARRRWGVTTALLLMLATLPVHLLGLALVALQVLSPATGTGAFVFLGGIGATQLLLLLAVATVAQLIGGDERIWRRRFALASLNAALVVVAAGVGWALVL